jgi:hypothetical protein
MMIFTLGIENRRINNNQATRKTKSEGLRDSLPWEGGGRGFVTLHIRWQGA